MNYLILCTCLLPEGIKKWPGKQIHSHNYRVPEPYGDQISISNIFLPFFILYFCIFGYFSPIVSVNKFVLSKYLQVVVVIGYGPSAYDIGIEISKAAKEVHLSSRSPEIKVSKLEMFNNLWQHSKVCNPAFH